MNSILKVKDLKKVYEDKVIFQDINFELIENQIISILGPSGIGKTTLLNIIGGLDSPTAGEVTVLNNLISKTSHEDRALIRRKHMGFIFQNYNLLPVYSVYENVELPLILNKIDKNKR